MRLRRGGLGILGHDAHQPVRGVGLLQIGGFLRGELQLHRTGGPFHMTGLGGAHHRGGHLAQEPGQGDLGHGDPAPVGQLCHPLDDLCILAGGRLSKHPGETSKRLEEDSYARFKYDATAQQDQIIIERVAELAEKHGVSMTEISLAWLLTKVTSPVVGATRRRHIEGAVKAVELGLTLEEISWLEEPYVPHKLVGVMAQNTRAAAGEQHVWSTGNQKIQGR